MSPLAAASTTSVETKSRLTFTNVTATEGRTANTLYVNTRVMVIDGPDPVENVTLIVSVSGGQDEKITFGTTLPGWGSTEQIYFEWPNLPKGKYTITFRAVGKGVTPITRTVDFVAPEWWA